MEKLKVYYGWAKLGNVRKRRALSVMFENEKQGCRSDRGQRCLRTIQDTVFERYQTEADRKGRHADTKKFNQEMDYYIHEMKLYGENYDKAYRDTFEYYLKDSVEDELSDACIRLLDWAGLRNVDLGEVNSDELKCSEGFFDWTFTESVFSMVCNITDSNYIETHSLGSFLRVSLIEILVFCVQKDIDIFWHIEHKMKYNELRPYKHGDKSY